MVTARRGEVWWVSLPEPRGSEPGYRHPVVVVQSNRFNESRIQTVLVAAVSSNLRLAEAPGNVRVTAAQSGLSKPSVVNVSQVLTLGKEFLSERVGRLPGGVMNRVADGLRLVLGL